MSKNFDDGGKAFPHGILQDGMTLRDYFAGLAMQGYLAFDGMPQDEPERLDLYAQRCYRLAQAMVAEKRRLEENHEPHY